MSRKKSILIMAALSAIVVAGFVSVSLSADEPLSDRSNGKANHHPRSVNG